MSPVITGIFVALIVAGALFASGYALLLLPKEKALKLPLAGRIDAAFGDADTLRFIRLIGLFMMASAVGLVLASLTSLLEQVTLFVP
ncbi:MAG: hypothetical protein ACK4WM_09235 [Thermoflexales bacterium]